MIKVKLEKFEGPLSLLVKLISKEELDITEVSLAKIANQYVDYIRGSKNINPEEMADFLVVAARLLLIKSKALLPYLYPEEEEEIEEFEQQLKMYQEFLKAAKGIEKMIGKKKFMFAREFNRKAILANANIFSPPKKLTKSELAVVFGEIIGRYQPPKKLKEKKLESKINIEDKIQSIQNMLINRIKLSFDLVLKKAKNKTEIIVSFLALLEMMRQKEVLLDQEKMFGEIFINNNKKS